MLITLAMGCCHEERKVKRMDGVLQMIFIAVTVDKSEEPVRMQGLKIQSNRRFIQFLPLPKRFVYLEANLQRARASSAVAA